MGRYVIYLLSMESYIFFTFALALCLIGSLGSVFLLSRLQRDGSNSRIIWQTWASAVCASSLWTAHLLLLIALNIPGNTGFQLTQTLAALVFAFAGVFTGFAIATWRQFRLAPELGSIVFAATIVGSCYILTLSYEAAGMSGTDGTIKIWPLLCGLVLAALAMNLLPNTQSRRLMLAAGLALALSAISLLLAVPEPATQGPFQAFHHQQSLVTTDQMQTISLLIVTLVSLGAGTGCWLDRSRKNAARRAYQHLSLQDPLTHLPNRHYVRKVGKELLDKAQLQDKTCAVVLISLDQFKVINDLHGYEVGDAVLCSMADTLKKNFSDPVFIARFYGDEFLVINPSVETIDDAIEFARAIRSLARRPVQWKSSRLSIRSSIGLAVFPRDGKDLSKLVQRANLAAKQAKSVGGNLIQPYVTGMEESNHWEASLAADLRSAAVENQLNLVFQRQNLTKTGELLGYEALVRWRHSEKGPIAPEDFIPIAERSGIILDIGNWVLEAACNEAASWSEPVTLSVNASPLQFSRSDFAGLVSTVLLKTGLPAERLEIELTESTPIEDHERVHETIVSLRKMGVRVAMDDFGKGYSSLNTLQAFSFDKIKVDRAFTQALETNAHARAILRSAILLGHSFGIPVIAEGVETERQLSFLKEAGCAQAQGFLFGKHLLPTQIKKIDTATKRTGS